MALTIPFQTSQSYHRVPYFRTHRMALFNCALVGLLFFLLLFMCALPCYVPLTTSRLEKCLSQIKLFISLELFLLGGTGRLLPCLTSFIVIHFLFSRFGKLPGSKTNFQADQRPSQCDCHKLWLQSSSCCIPWKSFSMWVSGHSDFWKSTSFYFMLDAFTCYGMAIALAFAILVDIVFL